MAHVQVSLRTWSSLLSLPKIREVFRSFSSYFSTKTYIVDTRLKHLIEMIPMSTISINLEISKKKYDNLQMKVSYLAL